MWPIDPALINNEHGNGKRLIVTAYIIQIYLIHIICRIEYMIIQNNHTIQSDPHNHKYFNFLHLYH